MSNIENNSLFDQKYKRFYLIRNMKKLSTCKIHENTQQRYYEKLNNKVTFFSQKNYFRPQYITELIAI